LEFTHFDVSTSYWWSDDKKLSGCALTKPRQKHERTHAVRLVGKFTELYGQLDRGCMSPGRASCVQAAFDAYMKWAYIHYAFAAEAGWDCEDYDDTTCHGFRVQACKVMNINQAQGDSFKAQYDQAVKACPADTPPCK
jgi:hypothetical protein